MIKCLDSRSSDRDGTVKDKALKSSGTHLPLVVEFRVGYNHVVGGIDRVTLWERRETLVGRLVKFRHQPSGAKEAPRFPKFIGFREAWDL